MTVKALARAHMQPVAEIERMLRQLSPNNPLIKEISYAGKVKITVYYPGYAGGIRQQQCVRATPTYHLHVDA